MGPKSGFLKFFAARFNHATRSPAPPPKAGSVPSRSSRSGGLGRANLSRVKNKVFAMYAHANNHHGAGRNAVWCKAKPVNQALMMEAAPDRFFSPPYVGPGGWIGVRLDGQVDWDEVLSLLGDGYRMTAPKKLLALLKKDS